MKRILLALLLVFIMSASAVAETTISGELQYGFTKLEDEDAVWDEYPGIKLKIAGDNWGVRFRTLANAEYAVRDGYSYDIDEKTFGVKVDRAYLVLPIGEFGKVTGGRTYFATSDNDFLGTNITGLLYEGTFDKLGLSAMWARTDILDSEDYVYGARATYAFDLGGDTKLTLGGTYRKYHENEDAEYAGDVRVDVGEAFDVYGEFGRTVCDCGEYHDEDEDIGFVCAEYRVAGFEFDGSYDLVEEEAEISVEKSINNVLFHLGYIMPEEDDADEIEAYAKVTF